MKIILENPLKVLKTHVDELFQVEEERQLEAMLWPKFSDGKHRP